MTAKYLYSCLRYTLVRVNTANDSIKTGSCGYMCVYMQRTAIQLEKYTYIHIKALRHVVGTINQRVNFFFIVFFVFTKRERYYHLSTQPNTILFFYEPQSASADTMFTLYMYVHTLLCAVILLSTCFGAVMPYMQAPSSSVFH